MNTVLNALKLRQIAEEERADLPALMAMAERAVSTIYQGTHPQKKPNTGEDFWQFREHNNTDRPQDIDWRQSAKTDRVYIKQKEWQTAQNVMLWCASGPEMAFSSRTDTPSKARIAQILTLALGARGWLSVRVG